MKKKKILIFLNKTSLAHTQIINSKFLNLILKKNEIILVSNYNMKKSKLLKTLNLKMVQLNETKQNSLLIKVLYSFFRSVKLHTSKNFKHNNTLKDFKSIFLNKIRSHSLCKFLFYVPFWLSLHNLLKINFFLQIFHKFESFLFYSDRFENLLIKEKPDLVITTSPGWWEEDNFFLYSSNKLNIKSICLILSWDQPTGMGLISSKCSEYLVWSKEVKKDLNKFHGISKKKINILGAIHWDHYFVNQKKKINKIKQVLICLKSPTRTNHENVIKMLKRFVSTKYRKKLNFVIRPHPIYYSKRFYSYIKDLKKIKSNYNSISVQDLWGKTNLKYKELNVKSPNISFLIDNENNFRNISKKNILESDLIINFFSTYTIEASILKTPIINYIDDKKIHNINTLEDKKNLYLDLRQNHVQRILKRIEIAYSFNQLTKLIDFYISNPKRNKKNIEKFYKSETTQKGNSIFLISKYLNNF
jgi:hypothetical protein